MLIWTPLALADREAFLVDLSRDDALAAVTTDLHVKTCAEQLINQVPLGCPGRVAGTREHLAEPCLLVYQLGADKNVTVLRVLQTAQAWPGGERNDE